MCRVGQNHTYTVYIRCFWQKNHQIYGHIRCIYTVLANPRYVCQWCKGGQSHVREMEGRATNVISELVIVGVTEVT